MRPAIFLDRDGVIIENREAYVRSWADVNFIPAALEALRALLPSDWAIVIATNQAAVGKGIITLEHAHRINQRVVAEVVRCGGRIDAAYLCPHRPDENCDCRKPKPGMLLRAARDLDLDLSRSVMIGDAITDMEAARAAGVRGILVMTGRGQSEWRAFTGAPWFDVADDLACAIELLAPIERIAR
ncbi:MAG: D-glycero-alpha-D-manno-heptose-1,7-bisphosphate 7-phosphatase [Candidatus Brachytrichaceae bacterium NZ_4S206]|jgi:histidinol-phosphate phosphatase family protein